NSVTVTPAVLSPVLGTGSLDGTPTRTTSVVRCDRQRTPSGRPRTLSGAFRGRSGTPTQSLSDSLSTGSPARQVVVEAEASRVLPGTPTRPSPTPRSEEHT